MKEPKLGMPSGARSVSDLLSLEREAFLVTAYIALLGRRPDADGLAQYLARMRDGMGKDEVILALVESEEGRRAALDIPGLASLLNATRDRRSGIRKVLASVGSLLLGPRLHAALRAHDWAIADRFSDQQRALKLVIEGIDAEVRAAVDSRLERIDAATAALERQAASLARLQAEISASLQTLAGAVGSPPTLGQPRAPNESTGPAIQDDAVRRVRARIEAV